MRESEIESYLKDMVEGLGGLSFKFVSPGRRDVPDRLNLLAVADFDIPVFFVECKAPGETPTDGQHRMHEKLRNMGHFVFVVDTKEKVDDLIEMLEGDHNPNLWRMLV